MGWPYQQKPPMGWPLDLDEPINRGLVGYWYMPEGSGNTIQDLSGNRYTGTIAIPTWKAGKFGPALDTTIVNHHVDTNTDDPFDLPELTVVACCNLLNVASGQVREDIVCKEGNNAGWMLRFDSTTGGGDKFEMIVRDGGNWRIATGAIARTANTWYQAVGRYSAASTDIIVNGKIDGTDIGVAAYAASAFDVWIGANPYIATRMFNGLISHVMIWNRFLSLSEEISLIRRFPFYGFMDPDKIPVLDQYYTVAGGISMPLVMQQMNHFKGGMVA